jgi:hypothetical protein
VENLQLKKGSAELLILSLLEDQPRHGYDLSRLIERRSAGAVKFRVARRMHTSRAALDRLLDPDYDVVTLSTLRKAATAVGRELRLELV